MITKTTGRSALGSIGVMAFNVVVGFMVTVLLARLLGPDEFGRYSFVYVVVLTLCIPLTSGLRILLMREVSILSDKGNWAELLGLLRGSAFAWAVYSIAVLLLIVVVRKLFSPDWFGTSGSLLDSAVFLLPLLSVLAGLSAVITGLQRVVLGQVSDRIFRPTFFIFAILFTWKVVGAPLDASVVLRLNGLAALGAVAISLIIACRLLPREVFLARPTYRMRAWADSVIPLTLNAAVGLVYSYTDIMMLGTIGSDDGVGQYRVATQGAIFVVLVMQALTAFVSPRIATQYVRGELLSLEAFLVRYALISFVPAFGVFLIYSLAGEAFLSVVFGTRYALAWGPLLILSLGQVVNVATGFVGPILNMTGHERETAFGTMLSAIINVILNLALIPSFGALGAATATCVSVAFWNLFLAWRVKRVTGLSASPLSHLGALARERG